MRNMGLSLINPKTLLTFKTWVIVISLGVIGLASWFYFEFPRASVVSLKVGRTEVLSISKDYLSKDRGENVARYHSALVFIQDNETWRYLQKALGADKAHQYLKDHGLSLFYWSVRFFREGEKGEYRLDISADNGRVLRFRRVIDETVPRETVSLQEARRRAEDFLKTQFDLDWSMYVSKDEVQITHDRRVDHTFSWRLKNADVPWGSSFEDGVGKLLVTATVSGKEILAFSAEDFEVPDRFSRLIDADMEAGRNFSLFFGFIYVMLLCASVLIFIRSKHFLIIEETKKFWIGAGVVLWVVIVGDVLNNFDGLRWRYSTSQALLSYEGRFFLQAMLSTGLIVCGVIITAFAGEALRAAVAVKDRMLGIASAACSSFFSRSVASSLLLGYCGAAIMLGLQAMLFQWGRFSFGVWSEDMWFTQFSGAAWPVLAAITLALRASVSEEVLFRLFALHWVRSFSRGLPFAVIISSFFWASGHAGYEIFPSWFRVLEVGVLGIFLSLFYLRFGLIAVIGAHYVFDVFWGTAGCLFTQSQPMYFISALGALSLPFIWALAAFVLNRSSEERPMIQHLTPRQDFNEMILSCYVGLVQRKGEDIGVFKQRCLSNGWDPVVVERAFDRLKTPDQA